MVLTRVSKRKPQPARSRSYRSVASKISSSASDATTSRRISASGAEASEELFADFRPRAGRHVAATVCSEALGNDLAMPVGDRYFLLMLIEAIPERLNVFELLVGRELVKAGRRKGRLCHLASILPSVQFRRGRACGGSGSVLDLLPMRYRASQPVSQSVTWPARVVAPAFPRQPLRPAIALESR